MNARVRVRFAPSPTGYLHVGGLRTALYNYLFARAHGGSFILRIEDTDRTRLVPGAVEQLIDSLAWAGLRYDEGPGRGGSRGPYLQSERTVLYRRAADRLLEHGHAYRCFCDAGRLEEMRRAQQAAKLPVVKYDRTCHRLSAEEVRARMETGEPYTVRLLIPDDEVIRISDLVRGEVEISSQQLDDQVLLKSDGFPTYHLANVVDDHAMEISHVIRGEEWLSSTPKHVLLYRHLEYPLPQFAHLPLLLNPDRTKLSKRQGDVAVEDYRSQDYFPEALINFVAFLGWNPGDERELFSLEELIGAFSLDRVNKAGAIFNLEKLRWFNQEYMRRKPEEELLNRLLPHLEARGWGGFPRPYLIRAVELMRERITFVREIVEQASWFFIDPASYDPATVKKRWKDNSGALLRALTPALETVPAFEEHPLEEMVKEQAETLGVRPGELIHPLRLACTGLGAGPGLYELMATLGRESCLRRIRRAVEALG